MIRKQFVIGPAELKAVDKGMPDCTLVTIIYKMSYLTVEKLFDYRLKTNKPLSLTTLKEF